MLTRESVRVLGKMLNFGHALGYSPYTYCHKVGKVNFDHCRRTRRKYLMVLSLELMYFIFLAIQFMRTVQRSDVVTNTKFKSVYFFMIHIALYFSHRMTLGHWGEHQIVLNGFIQTIPMLERPELQGGGGQVRIQGTLKWICIFSIVGVATRSFVLFTLPETPEVFISLAADPKSTPFILKCLTAMVHYYINGFHIYGLILHGLPIYGFVCAVLPVLRAIRIKRGSDAHGRRYWGWPYLTLSKVYTRLAILQHNFLHVYGSWVIGFEVTACSMSSVNLFMGVVSSGGVPFLFNGVLVGFYTLLIFNRFAEVHALASETIESWKWPTRCPLWFRKFQRSARPIRIHVGSFCFSDKALVLTILAIIIDRSTTLILTFRET